MTGSMSPETDYDVIVVGGGIAGLVAAWQLRDHRVLLLESDTRVGGRVKSLRRGDYWVNLGAHVFPHDESQMGRLAAELDLEIRDVRGAITAMALGDKITNPRRVELLPFILPLTFRERLSFVRAGLKVAFGVRGINRIEGYLPSSPDEESRQRLQLLSYRNNETFAEFIGKTHGRVERILDCLAHRAAADPDEASSGTVLLCSAHVMGPKDAPGATARVVVGGTEEVVHALAAQLAGRIRVSTPVRRVEDKGTHTAVLYEADGEEREVTALATIVATPAHVTREIVSAMPTNLDDALATVRYGAFLSLGVFTDEIDPLPIDELYAISAPGHEVDFIFNHAQVLREGSRRRGGSLMCYRGGPWAASFIDESDEVIETAFLKAIFDIVPSLRGHIVETAVQRWPLGTVFAAPGRGRVQQALESGFDHGRIALAGDYFDPLSGMEQAARAAVRAASRVSAALSTPSGVVAG